MQQPEKTEQPETVLYCAACGNDQQFDAVKTYFHKVILDGAGLVESSRVQSDLEGEELDITCRRCEAPVRTSDPAPLYQKIEAALEQIDRKRHDILELLTTSGEVTLEAADDLAVAHCAITDAANEIREELERHDLYPAPDARSRQAG